MATKQHTKRRTNGRSGKGGRGSSKSRTESRVTGAVARAFDGHGHDAIGLACVALALVVGLAVYADLAGPAGRGVAIGVGAAVGMVKVVVPLCLLAFGVVLLRGPKEDEQASRVVNITVGVVMVLVAVVGLLHLALGRPVWDDGIDEYGEAGGLLGAGVAGPLADLLSTAGAVAVLVALLVMGLVITTRVPVRVAADKTVAGVRPVNNLFRRAIGSLFRLGGDRADEAALYDQEADEIDLTDGAPLFVGGDGAVFDQDTAPDPAVADGQAQLDEADQSLLDEGAGAADAPTVEVHVPEPDEVPAATEQLEIALPPGARRSAWKLPKVKVLDRTGAQEVDRKSIEETGRTLEQALADHGVGTRLVGMVAGPTVTRYELELAPGVKVSKVTSLHKDIAYAMASPDVRILAPIPGKQALGVEVPNVRRQVVALGDILASEEARKATHPLEVGVGRDINGRPILINLAKMPHLLIAGATGAGKSSCINSIVTSLLVRSTPDQVRMILIDPKRVELGQYNRLPHLLTQVVTDPKKAANALNWAVKEMERRYDLLSEVGVRDIDGYNSAYDRGDLTQHEQVVADPDEQVTRYNRLPFIVVVVDELNDLMMVAARDVEESICRIAQMARAVGIHLIIATQRPSVNVITGVIKANVPARLAFAVSSLADSRVILDQGGAERLVGKGDMLLLDPSSSATHRIQGSWVTEEEVRTIVAHWRRQSPEVEYVSGVEGDTTAVDGAGGGSASPGAGGDDDDDLLVQAMDLVVRSQLGSTSMLQRKLRVGFARAGRLMDLLEERGVVGPSEGSKARAVLMSPEELDDSHAPASAD
jgi:S-DNA-T family DNA segregation ATPase FtsK/SpoIIIE